MGRRSNPRSCWCCIGISRASVSSRRSTTNGGFSAGRRAGSRRPGRQGGSMSSANASSRALRVGAHDGRTTCPLAHPTQGFRTRTDTTGRAGREWRSSHTRPLVERQRWPSLRRSPNGHSPLSRPADGLRWWRGHGRPTGAVGALPPGAPVRLACARARPLRRGAGGGGGFGGRRMRGAAPPGGPVLAQGSRACQSLRSEGVGFPSGGEGPIMGSGGA